MELLKRIRQWICGMQGIEVVAMEERIDLGAVNLNFEGGFRHFDDVPELYVAEGWIPWWHWQDTRPEFKRATRQDAPGNRVKSGEYSQQWFNRYAKSISGIYQRVEGITPGMLLKFLGWVMVWTCRDNEGVSKSSGRLYMKLGVDPYGGIDPDSSDIVWSDGGHAIQPYDAWAQLEVEAIAKSDRVTLWVWSYSEWEMANNNSWVDLLEFYGVGAAPGPGPGPEPLPEERVREIANEEITTAFEEMADQAQGIATGLEGLIIFLKDARATGWTAVEDLDERKRV